MKQNAYQMFILYPCESHDFTLFWKLSFNIPFQPLRSSPSPTPKYSSLFPPWNLYTCSLCPKFPALRASHLWLIYSGISSNVTFSERSSLTTLIYNLYLFLSFVVLWTITHHLKFSPSCISPIVFLSGSFFSLPPKGKIHKSKDSLFPIHYLPISSACLTVGTQ